MKKLEELTQDFKTSRPIFRLHIDDNGRNINARTHNPIHKYRPEPIAGDVLSELVCECYSEGFSTQDNEFVIDKFEIAQKAMRAIRNSIPKFLEKNLEMRNPRQSKLYRWAYRNMPNGSEINDVLVMVYKYLRSFSDSDMKANDLNHVNNGIAILEAIMEKYEQR